ncbi:MAG: putative secondary metabolism biosynthetic enzyme [Candelaria pacifica]|nr:MAG: putative secondary metabolism biosynthetic enzyme [Candelaria pacifica]
MCKTNLTLIQSPLPSPQNTAATPLILIHDGGGTIFQYFLLAPLSRPVYGIMNPHFETGNSWPGGLHEMATNYAKLIQTAIPSGQILLGGWSLGGYIALEVAHILAQQRTDLEVVGLIIIDSSLPRRLDNEKHTTSPHQQTRPLFLDDTVPEQRKLQVQRCFAQATEMLKAWEPPLWDVEGATQSYPAGSKNASYGAPPPTVLLRAVDRVPDAGEEGYADDPVDEWRKSRLLGWELYDRNFIQWVLDISGHHFNIFAWQYVSTFKDGRLQIYINH